MAPSSLARVARRLVGGCAIALTAVAGGSACQLALTADSTDPPCDLPPESPCGDHRICRAGRCSVCVPHQEICNGLDDDCDGVIDNGFDQDGDGYSTCVADKSLYDCNDDPATGYGIHPGAPEICNGIDDNCNGKIDEEPNDCSEKGLECWSDKAECVARGDCRLHGCTSGGCDPTTGKCTAPDCVTVPNCPVGTRCDSKSRTCVESAGLGDACDSTILCDTGQGQCVSASVLGLTGVTGSVCTTGCCSTDECPSEFVCRASGNGSSMCVRATDAGVSLGRAGVLGSCTTGADCRSGSCQAGVCTDVCCGQTTCANGAGACSIRSGDHDFLCRPKSGGSDYYGNCQSGGDCTSGLCLGAGSWSYGWCTKHCCSSADCAAGDVCHTADVGNGTVVAYCDQVYWSVGTKLCGDTCAHDSDCRSGSCPAGRCDDTCCQDSDCAGGTVCLPTKDATGYPMHCQVAAQ